MTKTATHGNRFDAMKLKELTRDAKLTVTVVREKNGTDDEEAHINGAIKIDLYGNRRREPFSGDEKRGLVQNELRGPCNWRFARNEGMEHDDNGGARLTQKDVDWSTYMALPLEKGRGDVEIDEIEVFAFAVEGW